MPEKADNDPMDRTGIMSDEFIAGVLDGGEAAASVKFGGQNGVEEYRKILREASGRLLAYSGALHELLEQDVCIQHGYSPDSAYCRDCGGRPEEHGGAGTCPWEIARAALSKPPRNCGEREGQCPSNATTPRKECAMANDGKSAENLVDVVYEMWNRPETAEYAERVLNAAYRLVEDVKKGVNEAWVEALDDASEKVRQRKENDNGANNTASKRKGTKTAKREPPAMVFPGLDIAELVEKTVREQVKKQVAERIDKLILAVIHGSTNLGIWCPHRDDDMIRLTEDARNHIRSEIQRSFRDEVLNQVCEMSESLKASIRQRVDENMALFEVGQGNWVFRIMGEQIKSHVAKTLAKTVKDLDLRSGLAPESGGDHDAGCDKEG